MARRGVLAAALLALQAAAAPYNVKFEVANLAGGGEGTFTVKVNPEWAPIGAQRFGELVKDNFFSEVRFFRVIDDFMAQFGISGDPATAAKWRGKNIKDDPNKAQNTRGRLTFATAGPNTRTSQIFINFKDNSFLDGQGFSPFAEVVEGMDVVDKLYKGYGEGAPSGHGPDQGKVQSEGNKYLERDFPKLTYIKSVTAVEGIDVQEAYIEGKIDTTSSNTGVLALLFIGIGGAAVLAVALFSLRGKDGDAKDCPYDPEGQELTAQDSPALSRKRGGAVPE